MDDKGKFTQADGTITIDGKTYVVTAEATANSETNSENGATTTPATAPDGTITGGSGKIVLTNTLQNPKFVLDIIKKDAEKGENNKDVPLGGVEFKLEKLVETTERKNAGRYYLYRYNGRQRQDNLEPVQRSGTRYIPPDGNQGTSGVQPGWHSQL